MATNRTQISASEVKVKDILLSEKIYSAEKIQSFIDGVYAVKYDLNEDGSIKSSKALDPLSVVIASEDTISDIKSQGSIDDDSLYLVESDNLNAYGKRITKVGYPLDNDDAATVQYVLDYGKKLMSEEYKSVGNAEVDEIYSIKTTDHVPTVYLNDFDNHIGNGGNYSGIVRFDLVFSKIFKKTSGFSQLKLKELTFISPTTLTATAEEEKEEYRLVLESDSSTIKSSNSVKIDTALQLLKFSFNEDIVAPFDIYTVSFESISSGQRMKTAFRMQNVSNTGLNTYQESSTISSKIPYIMAMSIVPVKAVDGILMKDNHGTTYCAEITNGNISIKKII